jgi:hypothetical protein
VRVLVPGSHLDLRRNVITPTHPAESETPL